MIGDLFAGRYRAVSELGHGAMGRVWLADDELLGRPVAVKQLRADSARGVDDDAIARMVREARTAARLHHRNIVTVFDLVTVDDQPHVIMEYVEGESLAERIAREGSLPIADVARIGSEIADGLSLAHRRGIVHRDIKPANILLNEDGTAKLADFGIARVHGDASLTQTGHMIGTIAYMAPEVARTSVATDASDIWSLGATLYAAIEGRAPFDDGSKPNTTQMIVRLVTESAPAPQRAGSLTEPIAAMLFADPVGRPAAVDVRAVIARHTEAAGRPADEVGKSRRPKIEIGQPDKAIAHDLAAVTRRRSPAQPPPQGLDNAGPSDSTAARAAVRKQLKCESFGPSDDSVTRVRQQSTHSPNSINYVSTAPPIPRSRRRRRVGVATVIVILGLAGGSAAVALSEDDAKNLGEISASSVVATLSGEGSATTRVTAAQVNRFLKMRRSADTGSDQSRVLVLSTLIADTLLLRLLAPRPPDARALAIDHAALAKKAYDSAFISRVNQAAEVSLETTSDIDPVFIPKLRRRIDLEYELRLRTGTLYGGLRSVAGLVRVSVDKRFGQWDYDNFVIAKKG